MGLVGPRKVSREAARKRCPPFAFSLVVRSHALGRKVDFPENACVVPGKRTGAAPRSGSAGSTARILWIPARACRTCRRQWRDCFQIDEVLVAALTSIVSMLEPHPVHSHPCLFAVASRSPESRSISFRGPRADHPPRHVCVFERIMSLPMLYRMIGAPGCPATVAPYS